MKSWKIFYKQLKRNENKLQKGKTSQKYVNILRNMSKRQIFSLNAL